MDQRMFQQILRRYFKGEASEEEKRIVDEWYEAMGKGYPTVRDDLEEGALEQRYWSVISGHITKTRNSDSTNALRMGSRTKTIAWYSLGVAASLLAVMISYYFLRNNSQPVLQQVTSGQQYATVIWTQLDNAGEAVKQFDLPDGSRISLEPHSQLKYGPSFNDTKREVFLEGEAHFEVAHNKQRPFLVHAREVTTVVLGTSFNVKAFKDDLSIMVAVQTGRVSVYTDQPGKEKNPQKPDIILTPNQQIVYNRNENTMLRSLVEEPQPIPAEEKTRRMRFEEASVAEIFGALERVYGVDISFDKNRFSSCVLTTSISDGGIYNRLDIICEAIGAKYTVSESQIVITGAGCD
jgi:transmembrane sensor